MQKEGRRDFVFVMGAAIGARLKIALKMLRVFLVSACHMEAAVGANILGSQGSPMICKARSGAQKLHVFGVHKNCRRKHFIL